MFAPYGWLHGLRVAVCLVLIAAPSLLGCALSKTAERNLRFSLAAFAVAIWLAYTVWWNARGIDWQAGLPLQLCDINGLMAPLALVTAATRHTAAGAKFDSFAIPCCVLPPPHATA